MKRNAAGLLNDYRATSQEGITMPRFTVSYSGFLQDVVRHFPTRERAEQWARQCGVFGRATITETAGPRGDAWLAARRRAVASRRAAWL